MKNIKQISLIAGSPLQLINCIEFGLYFSDYDKLFYILRDKNDYSFQQMKKILELYNLDYHLIERNIYGLIKLYFMKIKSQICVIGDYRSFFQKIFFLKQSETTKYLVDDGNITIYIQEKFLKFNNISITSDSKIKRLCVKLIMLASKPNLKPVNLFTIYDIEPAIGQEIIRNELNNLRKIKISGEIDIANDTIWIIGSNYEHAQISTESVIHHYNQIKKIYLNNKLIYFPHRKCPKSYINLISKLFYIKYNDYPIELEYLLSNNRPQSCIATLSGALYNLNILDQKLNCVYFPFDMDKLSINLKSELGSYFFKLQNDKLIKIRDIV